MAPANTSDHTMPHLRMSVVDCLVSQRSISEPRTLLLCVSVVDYKGVEEHLLVVGQSFAGYLVQPGHAFSV